MTATDLRYVGRHVRVLVVVPVEVSIPLTDVHPPEQETR